MATPRSTATRITELSAAELARLIAAGEVSAREAVEAHVARIEAVNPKLNAVVVRRFDEARAEAAAADAARSRKERLGPLHGVPVTIKESFDVICTPTTMGLPSRAKHRAESDAFTVARLRAAGAIVLGKTNVPQLLMMNESDNPLYGCANNPWDLARTPGGSSGGEAAILAAQGSPLGLGSDIGGSVRLPATACGICALKPTTGRLTMLGHLMPLEGQEAVIAQPGPMARTVDDLALAMRILAAPGQEAADASVPPVPWREHGDVSLRGLRVAFFTDNGFFAPSPAFRRAVREAAAALQSRGVEVEEWTPPRVAEAWHIYVRLMFADGAAGMRRALGKNKRDWRVDRFLKLVRVPSSVGGMLADVLRLAGQKRSAEGLTEAGAISTKKYWQLVEQRTRYRAEFLAAMDGGRFDAILCPPDALPAVPHGESLYVADALSSTTLYNLLGLPAGVVPATRVRADEESDRPQSRDIVEKKARSVEAGSAGLPIGVQVAARHWREDVALAVMAALEEHFRGQQDYPARPPL
jgi:fatty acid amide hydrolase